MKEDDDVFFNSDAKHSLFRMKKPSRQNKHLNPDDTRAERSFFRVITKDNAMYKHQSMGQTTIANVFRTFAAEAGVERPVSSNWARKSFCTMCDKILQLARGQTMKVTHHLSESAFLRYVKNLIDDNLMIHAEVSRVLSDYAQERYEPLSEIGKTRMMQKMMEVLQKNQKQLQYLIKREHKR